MEGYGDDFHQKHLSGLAILPVVGFCSIELELELGIYATLKQYYYYLFLSFAESRSFLLFDDDDDCNMH